MSGINKPRVTFNIVGVPFTDVAEQQRALIIGQKTASGTAVANDLIEVLNDGSYIDLVGKDSMLYRQIKWFKKINKISTLYMIPLDDNVGGTQAAGALTFSGTNATENGSFGVYFGSKTDESYTIPVVKDDTPTLIGDKLVALIAANAFSLLSAVNTTGAVALTFNHKGTIGDGINLYTNGTVAGITWALTPFSGGATDPVVTNIFDPVGDLRFQTIVWPYQYGLTEVETFLNDRVNVDNDVRDGVALSAFNDTFSNALAAVTAQNTKVLGLLPDQIVNATELKGHYAPEYDFVRSSYVGAVRALRYTLNADLSKFNIGATGSRDQFGGPHISTLPYMNTVLPDLPLGNNKYFWKSEERDDLLNAGGWVIGANDSNNAFISDEAVTTEKTDSFGEDSGFKYLNAFDTASTVREIYVNSTRALYRQSRLKEGPLAVGYSAANASSIRSTIEQIYSVLAGQQIVDDSQDSLDKFNNTLFVEIRDNGVVFVSFSFVPVGQLREIVGTIGVEFEIQVGS